MRAFGALARAASQPNLLAAIVSMARDSPDLHAKGCRRPASWKERARRGSTPAVAAVLAGRMYVRTYVRRRTARCKKERDMGADLLAAGQNVFARSMQLLKFEPICSRLQI